MALGINIVLGADTVHFNNNIRRATRQAEQQLNGLAGVAKKAFDRIGAINVIGGALSTQNLIQTADAMQSLASKVKITTISAQEYTDTMERLRQISNANQAEISATVELYSSSKRALDALGKSQNDVLLFTENLTKAMAVGGGSAEEQKNALTQLGQALNMGALKGQEFNSVSAQAPIILDLLVEKLGVSRAELKKMGSDGKLTANVIFDALATAGAKLDGYIAQMPITVSGALTVIKNEYGNLVHDVMNGQNGISQAIVNSLLWVGENFRTLVGVGATVATVMGVQVAHSFLLAKLGTTGLIASLQNMIVSTATASKSFIANAYSLETYNTKVARLIAIKTLATTKVVQFTETVAGFMVGGILNGAIAIDVFKAKIGTAIATINGYTASLVSLYRTKGILGGSVALSARAFDVFYTKVLATWTTIKGYTTSILTANHAKRAFIGTTVLASNTITAFGTRLVAVGSLINRHPLIFLATVIGTAMVGTKGLKGAMDDLGKTVAVTGVLFENFAKGVVEGISLLWGQTLDFLNSFGKNTKTATVQGQGAFGGFFKTTNSGFLGVIEIFAKSFDVIGAGIVAFAKTAIHNIKQVPRAIGSAFAQMANVAVDAINWAMVKISNGLNVGIDKVNDVITGLNGVAGAVGFSSIPTISKVGAVQLGHFRYTAPDYTNISENFENPKALQTALNNAVAQSKKTAQANQYTAGSYGELGESASQAGKKMERAGSQAKKSAKDIKDGAKSLSETQKAFAELMKVYGEQMAEWSKKLWDLKSPFSSEAHQVEFEILHGKFKSLNNEYKLSLRNEASFVDRAIADNDIQKIIRDNKKSISLLSFQENQIAKMVMDLNDKSNNLYLGSDKNKKELMRSVIELDFNKINYELEKENENLLSQLNLLSIKSELAKNLISQQQEQNQSLQVYKDLLKKGVILQDEYDFLKEKFENTRQLKEMVVIQTAYNSLITDLKTDGEKRTDALNEQLNVLGRMSKLGDANLAFSKLMQTSLNYDYQTFKIPELSTMDKITEKASNLTNTYNQILTVLAEQRQQNLLDETAYQDSLLTLQQSYANSRLRVEQDLAAAKIVLYNENLATASSVFESLADFTKHYASESSSAYRSLFFMAKSVNLATAGMNLWLAASDAFAKTQGSVWQKTAAAAIAVAKGGQFIAMIKAMTPIGQAHDGIMSVPKSGTWNLEKGERVLPKHTAQNLDNTLNRLQGNGSGQVINVNVTVNANGGDVQSSHDMGKNLGNAIKLAVQTELQKERRQGRLLYGR